LSFQKRGEETINFRKERRDFGKEKGKRNGPFPRLKGKKRKETKISIRDVKLIGTRKKEGGNQLHKKGKKRRRHLTARFGSAGKRKKRSSRLSLAEEREEGRTGLKKGEDECITVLGNEKRERGK